MDAPAFDRAAAFATKIAGETEFIAAVVGSIVGGVIAYIVQVTALREARRTKKVDELQKRQALAHSLLFKTIKIHSNIRHLRDYLEERFSLAKKDGFDGEPWQMILQLANPPPEVNFSADEMGMLLSLKSDNLFNIILSLDSRHNSLIEAMRLYNAQRTSLQETLKIDSYDGSLASGMMSKQESLALRPTMVSLNQLVLDTQRLSIEYVVESRKALTELEQLFNSKLEMKYRVEFVR